MLAHGTSYLACGFSIETEIDKIWSRNTMLFLTEGNCCKCDYLYEENVKTLILLSMRVPLFVLKRSFSFGTGQMSFDIIRLKKLFNC